MSFTVRMDNGDIEVGSAGETFLIGKAEKAAQDLIDEICLPYDAERDRGNQLFEKDGRMTAMASSDLVGQSTIKSMIKSAVHRLMRAQAENSGTDREEVIQKINSLLVQTLNNDPTMSAFLLSVLVDDENIGVARAIRTGHLGETRRPLVGGFDP